jgi:hypothetical protein
VPAGAQFCRECGASEDSGWNDDTDTDAYSDDSEDDFDYDDYIRREFPDQAAPGGYPWKRLILGILILLIIAALLLPVLLQ